MERQLINFEPPRRLTCGPKHRWFGPPAPPNLAEAADPAERASSREQQCAGAREAPLSYESTVSTPAYMENAPRGSAVFKHALDTLSDEF